MNKILFFIGIFLFSASWTWGQELTFASPQMEAGIRLHLGLDDSLPLTGEQLQTITDINLSGLGITDIGDVIYMPNLEKLDLHDNGIQDITPLLVLESLSDVDLSYNDLSSIFALSFTRSEKMRVNVAFNHIESFACFTTLTPCDFTIEGAGLQRMKDVPYFHVRYLYTDGTSDVAEAHYRVDSTTDGQAQLLVEGGGSTVITDDVHHTSPLPEGIREALCVTITDGTYADSTYLVPIKKVHVDPEGQVTVDTGLPDNYELGYSTAIQGTATIDGTTLSYTAPADFDYEEVIYSFHRSSLLRGLSKVIFTTEEVVDGISTAQIGATQLELTLEGNTLHVRCISETLSDESFIEVCDIAGRVLATCHADSHLGIDEYITLSHMPKDIIIVKVSSGRKRFVEKLVKK